MNANKHTSAARLAYAVRLLLMGGIVVVFGLFFLVGFGEPWEENPSYVAPRMTSTLMAFLWVVMALAVAAVAWSVGVSLKTSHRDDRRVNGIRVVRNRIVIFAGLAVLLLATFFLSPTSALTVNGRPYADPLYLRLAGMSILSTAILLAVTLACMAMNAFKCPK